MTTRPIPRLASTLARAVRGNVGRALAALRDLRPPLERAAAAGRERAEQGLSVDAVLHAYRISISAVWSRFGELARERGTNVSSVLASAETLWLWGDAVMEVAGTAHREVELQLAREEQQRHSNTLRHRLRRLEEATGANLRRPADLIELWWALERRRLGRTALAPPARSPTRGSSAAPAAGPV